MNKAFNTNAMRAIEWRIAIDKEIRIAVGQSCHIVVNPNNLTASAEPLSGHPLRVEVFERINSGELVFS
jgi:hypothetical protein